MSSEHAHVAGLLRKCEWQCDDAAHAVGGRAATPDQLRHLADGLTDMAAVLRVYANDMSAGELSATDIPTIEGATVDTRFE